MATFTAHAAVGQRESLEDVIYNISPTETPVASSLPRPSVDAVKHDWQTDALADAASNAQVEGSDASAPTATATVLLSDYCQIFRKVVRVSDTLRAVNTAGRRDELAYQTMKRGQEIVRDIEYAITRNQASTSGSAAGARQLAGMESWIATRQTHNGNGTTTGYSSGTVAAPTDGTSTTAFTVAQLKASIANTVEGGGDPGSIFLGKHNKQVASGFTGIATLQRDVNGQQGAVIVGTADWYRSDFGAHRLLYDRFSRDRTVLGLDMDYWAIGVLRPMKTTPLAKVGSSERRMLETELTLISRNEAASFKIADRNTS